MLAYAFVNLPVCNFFSHKIMFFLKDSFPNLIIFWKALRKELHKNMWKFTLFFTKGNQISQTKAGEMSNYDCLFWVWPGIRNDSEKWETELNIKELKYCDSRVTFITALSWQVEETGKIVPHITSITIWYNDSIW